MTGMKRNQIVDCSLYFIRESRAAICVSNGDVEINELGMEIRVDKWLAKSLVEYEVDFNTREVTVTMPYWLCEQEGFENDITET